jgi:AcrR family transcriptional regulator
VGTVYDYFPNKGAMLVALLARYQQRFRVQIITALSDTNLSTELLVEKTVRAFGHFYQNEAGYAELWLANQMAPELRAAGASWGADFGKLIGGLVQARTGIEKKQAERVAFTLVHSVSAVISLALTKPEAEQQTYIEEAVVLAKAYLGRSAAKF